MNSQLESERERLMRLETQMTIMLTLLQEIRSGLKDSVSRSEIEKLEKQITEIRAEVRAIEGKVSSVKGEVIKIVTILSTLGAIATLLVKFIPW